MVVSLVADVPDEIGGVVDPQDVGRNTIFYIVGSELAVAEEESMAELIVSEVCTRDHIGVVDPEGLSHRTGLRESHDFVLCTIENKTVHAGFVGERADYFVLAVQAKRPGV